MKNFRDFLAEQDYLERERERESNLNENLGLDLKNPTVKKMKAICDKYGYVLTGACQEKYGKKLYPRVGVGYKGLSRGYYPGVYIEQPFGGSQIKFTFNQAAYGSIDVNSKDCDEYLKATTDCIKMLRELSKIDLSTLPIEEVDS